MEKKQLFDNSLVDFHPEVFNPYLMVTVDIGENDYKSNFVIDQTVNVNSNFIDTYNKTPDNSVGLIKLLLTYTNDSTLWFAAPFAKGENGTYAIVNQPDFIYYITITDVNEVDKTIRLRFVSKSINSDNTVIRLTTRVNGLNNLTPGDFNKTVTLTAKEYNALKEIHSGEIFLLVDDVGSTTFLAFKVGANSIRANRDYIDFNLSNRSLISFAIELEENNQATFKGNINKLMDPDNYLAKDNTTKYTPTSNYHPATKKYVDDNISLNNKNVFVVNDGYNLLDIDSYSKWTETISIPKKLSSDNTLFIINMNSININDNFDNSIIVSMRTKPINSTVVCCNNISDAVGNKYNINILIKYENSPSDDNYYLATFKCEQFKYTQHILTESQYAALGTTPETDNVLYFVTPD